MQRVCNTLHSFVFTENFHSTETFAKTFIQKNF